VILFFAEDKEDLLRREVFARVPPKVIYRLTERRAN
jgi:DNA-binding HxlR family transcriptional regulator